MVADRLRCQFPGFFFQIPERSRITFQTLALEKIVFKLNQIRHEARSRDVSGFFFAFTVAAIIVRRFFFTSLRSCQKAGGFKRKGGYCGIIQVYCI